MEQINTPLSGVTDIVSMSLDLAPVNPNDIPNIKTSENEKDGTGVVA